MEFLSFGGGGGRLQKDYGIWAVFYVIFVQFTAFCERKRGGLLGGGAERGLNVTTAMWYDLECVCLPQLLIMKLKKLLLSNIFLFSQPPCV